mmetsp:Transcript_55649/g.140804  ORF Transcript_55649/g.140804 Transcript_55649/m.140804 type:complete len:207 (-) Transcript_55649:429-1049(-)
MVKRVSCAVELLHFLQQLLQILHLRVPLFHPVACVLHPQEAICIGANLKLLIVHVVQWVLATVETLDLIQEVLQAIRLCVARLQALPHVPHPQEAIRVVPELAVILINMVERICCMVQALHFLQQELELFHLAALDALPSGLNPQQAICIASDLPIDIICMVQRVLRIVQILDIVQQVLQPVELAAPLPGVLDPSEAIDITTELMA